MKYVIFKRKDLYMPIIFPEHITHSTIKIEDDETKIFSAGFLVISSMGLANVLPEKSESLQIGPSPFDAIILNRALLNSGTAAFLDFNF